LSWESKKWKPAEAAIPSSMFANVEWFCSNNADESQAHNKTTNTAIRVFLGLEPVLKSTKQLSSAGRLFDFISQNASSSQQA
jgi:hypothetical protein